MRKATALLSVLFVCVCLIGGCAGTAVQTDQTVELIVFAAASMTETLEQIGQAYEKQNPNVKLTFNFDSSGTLKTQIEEGAECDVFISAAKKQMDQLDITADKEVNTDGLDFVDSETRIDLLENKVALAVPEGNPKNINSYEDMVKGLKDKNILLAMGNERVQFEVSVWYINHGGVQKAIPAGSDSSDTGSQYSQR